MKVTVDVSACGKLARRARRWHAKVAPNLLEIAEFGAEQEKRTATYTDRTGDLREGTRAEVLVDEPDVVQVRLSMGEYYGTYVVGRGYSDFPEIAEQVGLWIGANLRSMAHDIASGVNV